jgi:hypothetical protein
MTAAVLALGLIALALLALLYRQARIAEGERERLLDGFWREWQGERTAMLQERQNLLERIQRPEQRPLPANAPEQENTMPRDAIGMAWVGKEVPEHMSALVGTSYPTDEFPPPGE